MYETCGVTMQFGALKIGSCSRGGSCVMTSSTAPAITPVSSARISSSSFRTAPRAVLMRYAPFFMRENSRSPKRPVVLSSSRTLTLT